MSERDLAFLVALSGQTDPLYAGRVFRLVFPEASLAGRPDAGATRTLISLERRGLVEGRYGSASDSLRWKITEEGRAALCS